ncbi:MAG: SLBB domain-containing protein [Candidatus Kapabacteria bacterium]|nr:SLBB domain-containing protein [Candidatus Kapabacteria bacterium]
MRRLLTYQLILLLLIPFYYVKGQLTQTEMNGTFFRMKIDTTAFESAQKLAMQTNIVPEKPINANEYVVGPGDEFEISILINEPILLYLKVSPEGSLLIPNTGIVQLKGDTLVNAYKKINEKLRRVYKTEDIGVQLSQIRQFKVIVSGSVLKSLSVAASPLDRVSEVIERAGGIAKDGGMRNISLIRDSNVYSVDLLKFFLVGDKSANPYVEGGDQIIVPPLSEKQKMGIYGEVGMPAEFEYVPGDSLSTLIRFGQGFLASSFLDSVEIARFETDGKTINRFYIDLNSWKNILKTREKLPGDIPLQVGDRVYVRIIPNWNKDQYVIISGEVKYPGKYAIVETKDKVADLIKRCGGFTENASIEDIEFIRQQESLKPDLEMERLARIPYTEMSQFESRYYQSRVREKRGVMSIDVKKAISDENSDQNITLYNKDSIIVPTKKNYINVQGRVNNPGNIVFNPNWTYMDYINQAGGFGYRADINETFIAKSKGEIFLAKDKNYILEPGDVILVPPQKEVSFTEVFTQVVATVSQLMTIAGIVITLVGVK